MAKRKKSKKQPTSDTVAKAPAPDASENAAPSETTADSLTADPPSAEASSPAFSEEVPPQADFAEPSVLATEAEFGEVWSEESGATSTDAPSEKAIAGEESTALAEAATEEPPVAEQQEVAEEATAAEEPPATAWAEAIDPATPANAESSAPIEGQEGEAGDEAVAESRLESILESLLFASDKPLGLAELKRLLGERDGKKVTAAVQSLIERRKGTGVEVAALSSGWHLRTNPENAAWVAKLLVGRPVRLSRAMLETLAIVAYRQPVTRPEVDDIRGVDCGPVLKTLLDRGLVRIIGKKEEVGRPMLYGTTPEFLRIFNLRDLSELPTLREFYDLSAEDQSRVEAEHGLPEETPSATTPKPDVAIGSVMRGALQPEPEETDPLLDELDEASQLAKQALGDLEPAPPDDEGASAASRGGGGGAGPEAPEGRAAKPESEADNNPPASSPPAGE